MKPAPDPRVEIIYNSFNMPDNVFHGLMALGVLKEIGIKLKGANHKAWSAFMQRSGRFGEVDVEFPAWSREELLEYAQLILAMIDLEYPLFAYVRDGVAEITDFSAAASAEYEHVINVGASINRPPYDVIRI